MRVLFVHQSFPGQYLHLAQHLAAQPGNQVVFITQRKEDAIPGIRKVVYNPKRKPSRQTHRYLKEAEVGVINGQEVAQTALSLKNTGFVPDVILGHNGWGEIWYLKDIYPQIPLIGYFEFFYRSVGADIGFEPGAPDPLDTAPRLRTRNVGNLIGLEATDLGQCPMRWQQSLYPERYRSKLRVVHEGIETRLAKPNPAAKLKLPNSDHELTAQDEVVTYVSRNLEPYRGFQIFMRSLPAILSRRPKAHVVIVGGDEVSYGMQLPKGKIYRVEMLKELGDSLDLTRVHFLGRVPYLTFLSVLQVSRVHVYLTYPFVLSWSMLDALSAGCLVIGSKTAPVEEVLRHMENGLLVNFFDITAIADAVVDALANPGAYRAIREQARRSIIEEYDLHTVALPAQLKLMREVTKSGSAFLWKGAEMCTCA